MVLTLPEITDRYYTYQFLDAWTESFAYVGTRATGGRAGTWVITPPGWDGELPAGAEQLEATTPQVFLLGRFLVDDEADIANVTAISRQTSLRPLERADRRRRQPRRRRRSASRPAPRRTSPPTPRSSTSWATPWPSTRRPPPPSASCSPRAEDARHRRRGAPAGGRGPRERPGARCSTRARRPATSASPAAAARAAGPVNGWSANRDLGRYGDDLLGPSSPGSAGAPTSPRRPCTRSPGSTPTARRSTARGTYRITFPAGRAARRSTRSGRCRSTATTCSSPSTRAAATRSATARPDLAFGDDGSLEIVLSHDEPAAADGGPQLAPGAGRPVRADAAPLPPGDAVLDGNYDYPPVEPIDAAE